MLLMQLVAASQACCSHWSLLQPFKLAATLQTYCSFSSLLQQPFDLVAAFPAYRSRPPQPQPRRARAGVSTAASLPRPEPNLSPLGERLGERLGLRWGEEHARRPAAAGRTGPAPGERLGERLGESPGCASMPGRRLGLGRPPQAPQPRPARRGRSRCPGREP